MKVECKSAQLLHFRAAPPPYVPSRRSFACQLWPCRRIAPHTLSKSARRSPRPAPRPLADRGPAPPPRRQLRRRRLPDPHRQRTPGHGHPAQPGHRHLENGRARQYRRRLPAPRPGRHPDPRNPQTAPSMSKTDTTRLRRGPGGCCTHLPYRHRLALEEGEVAGRGLRSLRRPARPPGSRRYRAAAHRHGRRSTAAGGLHVRDGPRPSARTG
jgi:hypothetical protein